MNPLQERLAACFAAVFPNRSQEEILSANRDSMEEWDSLSSVTLLALIQQEFDTSIDLFDFEDLGSFKLLLDHLEQNAAAGDGNTARA
jgi:acyl carrier protein